MPTERSSKRTAGLLFVLAAAGGILSGAVLSGVVASRMMKSRALADARAAAPPQDDRREPVNAARDLALEQRVSRLEDQATDPGRPAAPAAASPAPPPDAPPAEFYYRRHEEFINRARAEAVDPVWGPRVTEYLKNDVAKAKALAKFDVVDVQCRTSSCLVVLEWSSRAEALNAYQKIMRTPFRVNCEHSILIPETPSSTGKWDATMTFDCNDWRASGSELAPDVAVAGEAKPG